MKRLIILLLLTFFNLLSVVEAQQINSLTIEVTTDDVTWAGTDNDVHLMLMVSSGGALLPLDWNLDNPGNDFERGDINKFQLTTHLPNDVCNIKLIKIWKSPDHWYDAGGWKLGGIRLYYNDNPALIIYQNSNINKWLEDNHRTWLASDYTPITCAPPLPDPPDPADCYGICSYEIWIPGDDVPIRLPDRDCDGIADDEDPEPDEPAEDSDGDGIPDPREEIIGTDPNNADTDGDGIPDGCEDKNRSGRVDDGETGPNNPDTDGDGINDGEEDTDGDGLPDWYEDDSDPNNPDSDGDGWADGPTNVRTFLILLQIECGNEEEDIGEDELFVVVDDVRFPEDTDGLDGTWDMEEGDIIYPMIVVGRRVHSPSQPASYRAVIELWEDDWFDWTDDHWQTNTINFSESGTVVVQRRDLHWYDDTIYDVTFVAISEYFYDPDPTHANGDIDSDGLLDSDEHELSGNLQGLSDPAFPDIFLEMDWTGEEPEPYSKIDVVSQFFYHGYPIHLDDGDFQSLNSHYGGEDLSSYGEKIYLRTSGGTPSAEQIAEDGHFAPNRRGLFHYVLAVDEVGIYDYGAATMPIQNDDGDLVCSFNRVGLQIFKSDYLDHISDMESILFMHELGHTLGLCHRPEDKNPPNVVDPPICLTLNPTNCSECRNCSHYHVDQSSDTAMGTAVDNHWYHLWLDTIIDGIDREIIYEDAEWNALNLSGIRHWD